MNNFRKNLESLKNIKAQGPHKPGSLFYGMESNFVRSTLKSFFALSEDEKKIIHAEYAALSAVIPTEEDRVLEIVPTSAEISEENRILFSQVDQLKKNPQFAAQASELQEKAIAEIKKLPIQQQREIVKNHLDWTLEDNDLFFVAFLSLMLPSKYQIPCKM